MIVVYHYIPTEWDDSIMDNVNRVLRKVADAEEKDKNIPAKYYCGPRVPCCDKKLCRIN